MRSRSRLLCLGLAGLLSQANRALADTNLPPDLTQLSLEELSNIKVTSVSKKDQKAFKAAAAVFVITQDDIRRSGATNIPDVLRMAPGVEVGRIDLNTWAISIRGFNDRYSNKVLVLIDGRSVYSEVFSGVLWDQMGVPLEEIDRIEVIRGPGGTVWGANAVNGVINIITKSTKDTHGGLAAASAGTKDSSALVEYGGKIGTNGSYRAFGRYFNVDNSHGLDGSRAVDGWHGSQGGFRADWDVSPRDTLSLHGDLYQTAEGQTLTSVLGNQLPAWPTFNEQFTVGSGSLLGTWDHKLENGSETSLQVYYDRFRRLDEATQDLKEFNADFQYHFHLGSRQDVIAGVSFRNTSSSYLGYYDAIAVPAQRTDRLYTAFFQDEIALSNSVSLTFGSKFEHNPFTGFEYEPSAQLAWTPTSRQTFWLSAARAIRQPSREDTDFQIDGAIVPMGVTAFGLVKLSANPHLQAERLNDFEAGYRRKVSRNLFIDVAGYLSYYHGLRSTEPETPYFTADPLPPHLVIPSLWGNLGHAHDFGGEFYATWDVNSRWRLSPGYSFLRMKTGIDPASGDASIALIPGNSPKHQVKVRSSFNLTRRLEWDTSMYFVSALKGGFVGAASGGPVDSYTRADTRLAWRAGESVELSVTGQNLLTPRHAEFLTSYQLHPTESERSLIARIAWHF